MAYFVFLVSEPGEGNGGETHQFSSTKILQLVIFMEYNAHADLLTNKLVTWQMVFYINVTYIHKLMKINKIYQN